MLTLSETEDDEVDEVEVDEVDEVDAIQPQIEEEFLLY